MKSHELIAETLSEWRPVTSAAELAHESFDRLGTDEIGRLALRAYTDEIRAALRRKESGVPAYSNIDRVNPDSGDLERVYKQTALFNIDDYRAAVNSYARRAHDNWKVAAALASKCQAELGVQLTIPFEMSA